MESQVQVTFSGIDSTNNDLVNNLINSVMIYFNCEQWTYTTPDNSTMVLSMIVVN